MTKEELQQLKALLQQLAALQKSGIDGEELVITIDDSAMALFESFYWQLDEKNDQLADAMDCLRGIRESFGSQVNIGAFTANDLKAVLREMEDEVYIELGRAIGPILLKVAPFVQFVLALIFRGR